MELFRQTNIDFLRYKWIAIGASWLLIALGLFAIFVQKGLKSLARGKPSRGLTLANYQDVRIRHYHALIDRYLDA